MKFCKANLLKSTSKTVIEVDMFELAEFVAKLYNLSEWKFRDPNAHNRDMRLFDINQDDPVTETFPYFADYDLNNCLAIINQGHGDDWEDVGSVLARLCYDGFVPQGNYLVQLYW